MMINGLCKIKIVDGVEHESLWRNVLWKMIYNKIAYKMACANQGKSVMLINNKLHNGGQPADVIIYNSVTFFCKTKAICVS